jgi:hypothetical protein
MMATVNDKRRAENELLKDRNDNIKRIFNQAKLLISTIRIIIRRKIKIIIRNNYV